MRLLSFIMTLLLTVACGTDPEPRLYGTWFEPVTGEKVQLNEDGSLEWFGEIGTFEFARNSNAFCNIARNGCADGEVVFRLPSGSFRLTYRKQQFTSSPGIWASVLRTYGGALGKYRAQRHNIRFCPAHSRGLRATALQFGRLRIYEPRNQL